MNFVNLVKFTKRKLFFFLLLLISLILAKLVYFYRINHLHDQGTNLAKLGNLGSFDRLNNFFNFSPHHQTDDKTYVKVASDNWCKVSQIPCQIVLPTGNRLEILVQPDKIYSQSVIYFSFKFSKKIHDIKLELSGVDMNMGTYPIAISENIEDKSSLSMLSHEQAVQFFQAQTIIPICTNREMLWRLNINIEEMDSLFNNLNIPEVKTDLNDKVTSTSKVSNIPGKKIWHIPLLFTSYSGRLH